jgi:hypothetical protein
LTKPTEPTAPESIAAVDYFLEIEAHFASRRETPFLFSAKDWTLLKSWRDDGIPLAVVIEAIDACFDKRAESGRKKTISSLSYCRHAVKDLWSDRKDLLVGSESSAPETRPSEQLKALSELLLTAAGSQPGGKVRELLESSAAEVSALSRLRSVPSIEERLLEIEGTLIEQLNAAISPAEREALEQELDAVLRPYRKLEGETLRKTREANFKRLLRSRFAIPRLSLFG